MPGDSVRIVLTEDDLKELFSLFCSPTKYEKEQMYSPSSDHYFSGVSLSDEYQLNEEKREFALDAWRAVLFFLYSRGYSLCKDGKTIDLFFSETDFV